MLTAAGLVVAELLLDGSSILAPLVPAYTRRPADARDAASLTEDLANGVSGFLSVVTTRYKMRRE